MNVDKSTNINTDYIVFDAHVNLQELYDLGCRKIAVVGLPPIGCLPIQMSLRFQNPFNSKCIKDQNLDAQSYNQKLVNQLSKIQAVLPESKISYSDVYEQMNDMINNPQKYGKLIQPRTGNCNCTARGTSAWPSQEGNLI